MSLDNNKTVSFILPVYQVKDTLRQCVLSCMDQKNVYENEYEVILIDDGSTDGSGDICDGLREEFGEDRIKVVHTSNFGVSHARNIGLERATARFVSFVDTDDRVSDCFIENMIRYADEGTALVDETSSYEGSQKISGFQYIENSVLNRNTHVWGKLFDRKTLTDNNIRFEEGLTIGEDLLFLIDFALSQDKNHTIRCVSEGDYIYSDNAEGAMNRSFKKSYMDQLICWKKAQERLEPCRNMISPYAFVSVAVSQVMTVFLVIGKVALWDDAKKDEDLSALAISQAGDRIKSALKTGGCFAALSFGYKIKTIIFRISPALYIRLYSAHKKGK